tara:strand:- start:1171 stop:1722 length:552 start_codon:yes stop_codon:yes gene_type:complete
MEEVKTFEVDTWIFFNRDSFNLKGYRYNFCEGEQNLLTIDKADLPKLKKELTPYLYDWATEGGSDTVLFSEDDFEDTYNPFKGLHWEDYYKDLDIPKDWENISYSNDEYPSFLYKDYQIWINSPLLSERKESYLGIGFKDLTGFKDWVFTVCSYDRDDCASIENVFDSLHLSEVINFLKEQSK